MNDKTAVKIERMHLLNGDGSTKAFCDLVILDSFLVKGLRIVQGTEELFVGMPSEQGRDGKWYETFHPTSKEIRTDLQKFVLRSYAEHIKKESGGSTKAQ